MRPAVPAILAFLLMATTASPCSTFCYVREGEALFGRNYDFEIGSGFVLVNQRGVAKHSVAGDLRWVSRYGSVTFNQFGKEFPMDGMNEAGLVVALMWLEGTEYPPPDERPRLGVLEWIQYQLDNHASIDEVLASPERGRIRGGSPLHYLIADRSGAAATIEYLEGRLITHRGASLPTATLTNSRYDESVAYLRGFTGFGGSKSTPSGSESLERFARTAMLLEQQTTEAPRDRAFSILDAVAQGNTRWSVVYEASTRRVTWKTRTSPGLKALDFGDLDFACGATPLRIDANSSATGDVASALGVYSAAENLAQLIAAYAGTSFLSSVPRDAIERTAAHAESFSCAPPAERRRGVRR